MFSEFNETILIQIIEPFRIDFSDKKSAYTKPDAPYYVDNGPSTQVVIQYESSPLDAADDKCPKCLGSSSGLFLTHFSSAVVISVKYVWWRPNFLYIGGDKKI